MSGSSDERRPNLYQVTHQVLTTVTDASAAINAALDPFTPVGQPDPEPIDPWLFYVLCDELGACLEELSVPLKELGEHAAWLAGAWDAERGQLLPRDEERPMVVQLDRAARALRRAARLAAGAGAATMQPGLKALVEDLEVRLPIPDRDPPQWVVLQGWGETGYRVRDARADSPPLHQRPFKRAEKANRLAAAIADVAGISLDTVEGETVAVDLAHQAVRRLEAMASQRDEAYRHLPSGRLPEDPEPEDPELDRLPRTPDVLAAAVEDLADREGRRDTEPLGLGLAMALATVADAHPDSLAGLLAHPDEDPRAGELVRALAELGRAAQP